MLTYNDCLGLSGLTPEQVAALARHEHLPEIVALEMGWSLCGTPEGRRRIRQMILDEVAAACRHGDPQGAARLGLALHHFLDAYPGSPAGTAAQDAVPPRDAVPQALGLDPGAASRVRERLDTYLAAMLQRFGLDQAEAEARFPAEMLAAAMCCASCTGTGRCRRFLSDMAGAEAPPAFCPNARLLAALGPRAERPGA
ncbi:DUF6455 family protein [Roseicella aerolata]|uniref:DUF6455 family protein n=1 Tax=Roseicella aerolata TaxID=2883479 RepID=A0A9X1L8V0_9PROT|nr:DUF6455 family protein [Roseicella aerolata]MCB4820313.1 DUF6455 family protein [Roseicella aerolata]